MIGQPEVESRKISTGDDAGKWDVEVKGFDYFDTKTGKLESGGASKIAVWLLDTDYEGRSLYPSLVFYLMADNKSGLVRLIKSLAAEVDEGLIEAYRGVVSLAFDLGDNWRVAVKIVDDGDVESLRVVGVG